MSKSLIIAEKPSVAQDIVRALTPVAGKFDKHDEYFESERYIVTSAVGHLLEIKAPEEFDVKRGKWSFAHLPVIPPHFELAPLDKTKTRLNAIVRLAKRKDIGELINACDAGREGELIFRLIQQHAKTRLPVRRLWLQSMTPQAIREGFEHLRSRPGAARAGGGGAQPLGGRLAGRHQRHARDDGVQLARRRVLSHDRRPGADADALDHGRARGADPQARRARLLGGRARPSPSTPASTRASGSIRRGRRTRTTPSSARTGSGPRPTRTRSPRRCRASRRRSARRPSRARRRRRCSTT